MFVTIHSWEPVVHEVPGAFTTTHVVYNDNSWKGDVLLVKAVAIPFIVVDHIGDGGRVNTGGIRLDTRRVSLMELPTKYCEAAGALAKGGVL